MELSKALVAAIEAAENEGDTIDLRIAVNGKEDDGDKIREKITRVNAKLDSLKERYDAVKKEAAEDLDETEDEEAVVPVADAAPETTGYNLYLSALEDKVDSISDTVAEMSADIDMICTCLPQEFSRIDKMLTTSPKLKKRSVREMIDAINHVKLRQHEESLGRYADLKGLIADLKAISLENKQKIDEIAEAVKSLTEKKSSKSKA